MVPEMIELVESKLEEKWRPEQISRWILLEERQLLCHETPIPHLLTSLQCALGEVADL